MFAMGFWMPYTCPENLFLGVKFKKFKEPNTLDSQSQ